MQEIAIIKRSLYGRSECSEDSKKSESFLEHEIAMNEKDLEQLERTYKLQLEGFKYLNSH